MSSKFKEALEKIVNIVACYFPDFTLPKNDDELIGTIIEEAPDYTSLRNDIIEILIIARTALAEPSTTSTNISQLQTIKDIFC